ncbi:CopD family protein [Gordonia sp. ABSL1-1]|nr:CopD family protein [Gordonia sp. ABSL1-1]MDL9935999.1 CopD family protein [Gordonia sp. ABSL1-1]
MRARTGDLLIATALPVLLVGVGVCWVLARPDGPGAVALPASIALGASTVLLGLGALPSLGAQPSTRIIGVLAALWLSASVVAGWLRTADQSGVAAVDVDIDQFGTAMSSGAAELVSAAAALLILAWVSVDLLTAVVIGVRAVAVVAAVGVLATAVGGHASLHVWGPVLVGAHALAAAWWCGTLAAMVLTLRGRSGWAATLPEFSRFAVWAVGVIAATGVIVGVVEVGGITELATTGYGRILLAKLAGLSALAGLGWWHRRTWVPAASRHRMSEAVSVRHGVAEVMLMAVVLGLAAGLSATAP